MSRARGQQGQGSGANSRRRPHQHHQPHAQCEPHPGASPRHSSGGWTACWSSTSGATASLCDGGEKQRVHWEAAGPTPKLYQPALLMLPLSGWKSTFAHPSGSSLQFKSPEPRGQPHCLYHEGPCDRPGGPRTPVPGPELLLPEPMQCVLLHSNGSLLEAAMTECFPWKTTALLLSLQIYRPIWRNFIYTTTWLQKSKKMILLICTSCKFLT